MATNHQEPQSPSPKPSTKSPSDVVASSPSSKRARQCHIRKWSDYTGYGFNLYAIKGRPGQYVQHVEKDSPAYAAGLRNGDRIVEVNGTNVASENHLQVVQRIRAVDGEVVLLVVDTEADKYFRDNKILVSANMADIDQRVTPPANPHNSTSKSHDADCSKCDGERPVSSCQPDFKLRLCHVYRWPDVEGYGFNVHTIKDKPGQYIGKVEPNSPAEQAGLHDGDRIIEVNGVNVERDFHHECATKIQSVLGQVKLLVVDRDADEYFKERGLAMSSKQPYVERLACAAKLYKVPEIPLESCPHRLRLCHLRLRPHSTTGYGFTVKTDVVKSGQFVDEVDVDSPAEESGLRPGDRLVEVNGVNVETDSHYEVIERIKAIHGQTRLLVVDADADSYFRENKVPLSSRLPFITFCATSPKSSVSSPSTDEAPTTPDDSAIKKTNLDVEHISENNNNNNNNFELKKKSEPPLQSSFIPKDIDAVAVSSDHKLRLCRLARRPDFDGYGFNVHTERYRAGQFVGQLEHRSPAEVAGLRVGDRIIEVNGVNVETDSHSELAQKIGASKDVLVMLVVDQQADDYFRQLDIPLTAEQPFVERRGFETLMNKHSAEINHPTVTPPSDRSPVTAQFHGRLRLCRLRQNPNHRGYGFVLLAEQSESTGLLIGHVEPDSPAASGGLRSGDRIIEVNGKNVEKDTHEEAADKIRAIADAVDLLVVDDHSDRYFKRNNVTLSGDLPFVDVIESQVESVSTNCSRTEASPPDDVIKHRTPSPSVDRHQPAPVTLPVATIPPPVLPARLCHMRTWSEFRGYGFDVISERLKPGHYIGKVDVGSPAASSGLREGDLIVQVNGVDVLSSSHDDLAARIKSIPGETKLLVVDAETERKCRVSGVVLSSCQLQIDDIVCPERPPPEIAARLTTTTTVEHKHITSNGGPEPTAVPDSPPPLPPSSPPSLTPPPSRLRLCHVKHWPTFDGYGFSLHIYHDIPGQFVVGDVERGSPAEAGGLRRGDRIVEVNGTSVEADRHEQVVQRIKSDRQRVRLLVTDNVTYAFCVERRIEMTSSQPFVDVIECPDERPDGASSEGRQNAKLTNGTNGIEDDPDSSSTDDGLKLASSAREARERLRKKLNVKNVNMSLQEKHELFEML